MHRRDRRQLLLSCVSKQLMGSPILVLDTQIDDLLFESNAGLVRLSQRPAGTLLESGPPMLLVASEPLVALIPKRRINARLFTPGFEARKTKSILNSVLSVSIQGMQMCKPCLLICVNHVS